jgi:hypothetical protein
MKHLFTLIVASIIGGSSFGQVVFESDLSTWSAGDPTGWMGTSTNIASADVTEQTLLPQFGTAWASLMNTSPTSHKRFTTQAVTVTEGETYTVTMYVYGTQAEYRTGYYDLSNTNYGNYNPYLDLAGTSGALQTSTQNITIPFGSSCTSAEFILSVRNTQDLAGIGMAVDSFNVKVAGVTHTPKTIYEIQYTTAPSGNSPEMGNYVETAGVVTAVNPGNGYWIQDGDGAFNGVFVADMYNTPSIDDSVTVKGQVVEFFERTQIENIGSYTLESAPSVIPNSTTVTTPQIQTEEDWEGVLIETVNVECTNQDAGFGMWTINTNPGTANDSALVEDDLFSFTPILGNAYGVTGIGDFSYGDRKILPRDINDINGTGSGITPIYDIQYTTDISGDSPLDGVVVTTTGIVTGIFQIGSDQDRFFIQDGSGAWNGIFIYETNTSIALGDSVSVTGEVLEFNNLTEIGFVTDVTIISSGNTEPAPAIVTNATVTDEEWEGVLVTLENGICTVVTDGFGVWNINDGSASDVKIDDDLLPSSFTSTLGDGYTVTGVRHYSFSENKIYPRTSTEIVTTGFANNSENVNDFSIYPNPASDVITISAATTATVEIYSITGALVINKTTAKTIDISDLEVGMYQVVVTENEVKTTKKLIIQ